jgi:hypothetical protein
VEAATLNTENTGVDIFGGAYLKAPNGMFAEVAFGFDNFYQCNYEIWGSKGKLTVQRAFTPGAAFKPQITLEQQGNITHYEVEAENHFITILNEFKRCVLESDFESKYEEILNQSSLLQALKDKAN